MVSIVLAAAQDWIPIYLSSVMGCFVLLITGCLQWKDVTQALSTQVVFIIVASLALGTALMATGAADYLADSFVVLTHGMSPAIILGGLLLSMPVEPFILPVLFGANLSFATPIAYKTNLLVMTAGGYQLKDFMKVGIPLALIIGLLLAVILS